MFDFALRSRRSVFLVSSLTFVIACHQGSQTKEQYSKALIVLPGAANVRYEKFAGEDVVSYEVIADYPAADALSFISKELARQNWKALREDYLNPGIPSSHVRGWTEFGDATRSHEEYVHQWLAQWDNNSGDVLWYTLQYRNRKGSSPDLKKLMVFAAFIPSGIARKMKESLEQQK